MQTPTTDTLRYPIGKYKAPETITPDHIATWIQEIADHPAQLRTEVASLTEAQLDTPYRLGGWTIRQVVHHLPDSHMNSYVRFKWAMTESGPTIKPYYEDRWAETVDGKGAPVGVSLDLLTALHQRWTFFLKSFSPEDWEKEFIHPESGRAWHLDWTLGMYAWHGKHHLAHITELKKRMGWD